MIKNYVDMDNIKEPVLQPNNRNYLYILVKILFTFLLFLPFKNVIYSQSGFVSENPKIAYWEYGSSKTIIIIINGGPGFDHSYLRPEWDTLSTVSKIIYYDQRGCGGSDNSSNYTWIEHLKDLKKLKDHFSPEKKIILAGSSWGTNLALIYALYFPKDVKALILSGFTIWPGVNSKKSNLYNYQLDSILDYKRSPPRSKKFQSLIKLYSSPVPYRTPMSKLNEMYDPILEKRFVQRSEEMHSQTYNSLKSMPELPFLSEIKVPTLIIKGGLNCGISDWSEILNKEIKGSELYTIMNSCHDPWFKNPDLFFTKCFEFINSINH
jgi:pimeloyl-ACP methyl ester carboxylesterase